MKIAILGWGSLIWQPKELNYDKTFGWNEKGPFLPIEFSRISNNGRLTLVIDENAEEVQTLYTISSYENLDETVLDLAVREGSSKARIGWYNKNKDAFFKDRFPYKKEIKDWMKTTDCDAVIWTNLGKKFKNKIGLKHTPQNVIKYLETLPEVAKVLAEEYIRKTPQQIKTKIRQEVEKEFGWTFIKTKKND